MTNTTIPLETFPNALASFFETTPFIGGIMCSIVLCMICLLPILIAKRGRSNFLTEMIIGFVCITFCMATGWLPAYVGLVINLLIAIGLSTKLRDWLG